jgi:hypothetical protein
MRAPGLRQRDLADLFDRLLWLTKDNGSEVLQVRDQWLTGDDPEKVEIALLMNEVFPAKDKRSMVELFNDICRKWPGISQIMR